jgi:gliding motility-associated-like protein
LNKPFYIFLFILVFCCEAKTQANLVPNGSFEDTLSCPNNGGQIGLAKKWFDPNLLSSDLFHSCASINYCAVPINYFGYQQPYHGFAYAGITTFWNSQPDYREYVGVELEENLINGTTYCVTLSISLADSCQYGINNIYVGFYNDTLGIIKNILTPDSKYLLPHINEISKNSWSKTTFSFIANGFEKYLTIGNFDADSSVNIIYNSNNNFSYNYSYYYLDSIELKECEIILPNVFTPNGDGANDFWRVDLLESSNFNVFNRWGVKIFETTAKEIEWDGNNKYGELCTDGIYFFTIESKEKHYKGHIQLIR